jgi:hypothetical protein
VRAALIEELIAIGSTDPRVVFLTADLGWSVVEPFAKAHPTRFFNVGVAEANMASVAAGLAQEGFVPFIYSIATFSSMRCYEQVRNGAILQGLPVRVVGIGGGYAYGRAGPTHHALEDIAITRTQPGLAVIVPADPAQTRAVVRALVGLPGPAYLRIGKGGNPEPSRTRRSRPRSFSRSAASARRSRCSPTSEPRRAKTSSACSTAFPRWSRSRKLTCAVASALSSPRRWPRGVSAADCEGAGSRVCHAGEVAVRHTCVGGRDWTDPPSQTRR